MPPLTPQTPQMLTIFSVPPGVPVLVGRLHQTRNGYRRRPTLVISIWEPVARRHIEITLPDDFMGDAAIEAHISQPLCKAGSTRVYLAADPSDARQTRATIDHFRGRLRAWRREQELAGLIVPRPRYFDPARQPEPSAWVGSY
jgi:hypothetical protein